jgi:hypothetical protein
MSERVALTCLLLSTLRLSICELLCIASGGPQGIMTLYGGGALQHIIWGCITRAGVVSTLGTSEIQRFGA